MSAMALVRTFKASFWFFLLVSDLTSAFCRSKILHRQSSLVVDHRLRAKSSEFDVVSNILLPIFPLRKKVRLPTESLTLNLYEDRYLQMAEYILQSGDHRHQQVFGALFTANKPHMVARGTGPIVPMVEVGDTGVLCLLDENDDDDDDVATAAAEEAEIPTVGGTTRRRIRLVATAAARFRIHRILHTGYGGSATNDEPLPFILAEAEVLADHGDSASLALLRGNPRPSGDYGDGSEERLERLASRTSNTLAKASILSKHDLLAELRSFALAARKLPEAASKDRLDCLLGRDTQERFRKYS